MHGFLWALGIGFGIGLGITLAIGLWAAFDIYVEGDWSKVWARNFNRRVHQGRHKRNE